MKHARTRTDDLFMPVVFPSAAAIMANGRATNMTVDGNVWRHADVRLEVVPEADPGRIRLRVTAGVSSVEVIRLRWRREGLGGQRFLGDHWERGYGDLEWRGLVPHRVMPWYFIAGNGQRAWGCGVTTRPRAFCSWTADDAGIQLWLDLRNGGGGVELGERTVEVAEVVQLSARDGESPFAFACRFCRALSPDPRMPAEPVYGGNDWYYAYGHSTRETILRDCGLIAGLADGPANRPFMVIDGGWQARASDRPGDAACGGPWDRGNRRFPDMPSLASAMRQAGVRPGIWIRPLAATLDEPAALLLPEARITDSSARAPALDPSIPENLQRVEEDFARLRAWGFELIKHDWSSCDFLGRWGFDMLAGRMTNPGWHPADRSRTNAELILDLFAAIRRGADSALIIGCNTFSHLAAGLFEIQRTGDDTSGTEWERTCKMGINTLAFRMCQHGAFYAADADCVGLTRSVPWHLNRQWLALLAGSGTPLFVSPAPDALGADQRAALRAAFRAAADVQPVAEPCDWLDSTCPSRWRMDGRTRTFAWHEDGTEEPFA